jgi:hypothetical protein
MHTWIRRHSKNERSRRIDGMKQPQRSDDQKSSANSLNLQQQQPKDQFVSKQK